MGDRILIVEDQRDLGEPLALGLAEEGFETKLVTTGRAAMQALVDHWDLIILDLTLPDIPGEAILSNLRQSPDYPAILVVTARGALDDKLNLFRLGCDDYLAKPVIFEELVERVRALLRRSQRVHSKDCAYRDVQLNPETHLLNTSDGQTTLTPKESAILRVLMERAETVVSRKELLHHAWGLKEEPETNFIGVHLFNLRKKLHDVERDSWLKTVRNSGFVFGSPEIGHEA